PLTRPSRAAPHPGRRRGPRDTLHPSAIQWPPSRICSSLEGPCRLHSYPRRVAREVGEEDFVDVDYLDSLGVGTGLNRLITRHLDVLDYLGDCRLHELLLQLLRAGDVDPGVPRYLGVAVRERHVGRGDCAPAPGDSLCDDAVADAVRTNRHMPIHLSHDAPATVAHRDEVGHPEVCPDSPHLDGAGRLPGEPLDENPGQGRRPAYVDDDSFVEPREKSRSPYAVGGARKDCQDRVSLRVLYGHHGPVVLAEEVLRANRPPL